MDKKLFVGGLAWETTEESLKNHFSRVGTVESAMVITDRATGRSKGFGFVTMATPEEAEKAIQELNDKPLDGRNIRVNEAQPKEERPRREFSGPRKSW